MIGYLRGTILGIQKLAPNRIILCLDVQGVGYDLLIPARLLQDLPPASETVALFTHLQVRDDQLILYGFGSAPERDLFRQLISVSGVGPQLGLALLDSLGLSELVQAIVSGNTHRLSRTPGVGTKTAERLALELKTKLAAWRDQTGLVTTPQAGPMAAIQEDVEMTLLALGYTAQEIRQALDAVGQTTALAKNTDAEAWLRETITWLSR